MATKAHLSGNDAAVLGALFDPETSLQNHARIDLHLNGPYILSVVSQIKEWETNALRLINNNNPQPAQLRQAISELDEIVMQYPEYPSAWNNRAQARRMLSDLEAAGSWPDHLQLVFADLARSIELASPQKAVQMTSPDNAKVLASAHTHRGYLLWKASRPEALTGSLDGVDGFEGLSKDRLEELASRDFSLGGKYGNQIAQQLAVKTNPYAKLCGSIVREALQKEIKDFYQQSAVA